MVRRINIALLFLISLLQFSIAESQQRKANTSQSQFQAAKAGEASTVQSYKSTTKVRILAQFDFGQVTPSDLNSGRSEYQWNSFASSPGSFSAVSGYSFSLSYRLGGGFLGLNYSHASQELSSGSINASGTTTVQDTFEYDLVGLVYDWNFQSQRSSSYDVGIGAGQAVKYRFHSFFNTAGVIEDLYWEDIPYYAKIYGGYSFHFSENVHLRTGLEYLYVTSGHLAADRNHPAITDSSGAPITSGEIFRRLSGSAVKADLSGFKVSLGLGVAF